MTTKKLLVAFNPVDPDAQSDDFLVPIYQSGLVHLMGMESGYRNQFGMVVYIGEEIGVNDILKRLEDGVHGSYGDQEIRKNIELYLEKIEKYKIGNIVEVERDKNGDSWGLRLSAVSPSAMAQTYKVAAKRDL